MDVFSDGPPSDEGGEVVDLPSTMTRGQINTWRRLTRGGLHQQAWKAIFDRVDMPRCVLVPPAHTPTGFIRAAVMYNEALCLCVCACVCVCVCVCVRNMM